MLEAMAMGTVEIAVLRESCEKNGLEPTKENMALVAFLNDADFRERVTRFYFDKAMRDVR